MKGIRILFVLAVAVQTLQADESPDIIPQQGRIGIGGVFQSWKAGDISKISEFSIPVEVYYPVNRKLSFGLFLGQATANGDTGGISLKSLSGITDAQAVVNYYLEDQNLLFSLGANLPSGKREMSVGEYSTSIFISQNFYNFQVPMFGQGFNLSPGFTWAKPFNDKTVLGFGASYQFKGEYIPIENGKKFKPGNELLLTGGADYQISEVSAASFDLTVTLYGKDKYNAKEIYKAGAKVMAAAQYKQYFNYDLLWLFGCFRSRSKSDIYAPFVSATTSYKTLRDEFESIATYKKRINKTASLSYCLEARYFFRTGTISSAYQGGGGILPEFRVSPKTKLQGRFKLLLGRENNYPSSQSVLGIEIGAGMEYAF